MVCSAPHIKKTLSLQISISSCLIQDGDSEQGFQSTLTYANEVRDWRITDDYAQHLIGTARKFTRKTNSSSISSRRCTTWMRQQLICACLYTILLIISVSAFERTELNQLLTLYDCKSSTSVKLK